MPFRLVTPASTFIVVLPVATVRICAMLCSAVGDSEE